MSLAGHEEASASTTGNPTGGGMVDYRALSFGPVYAGGPVTPGYSGKASWSAMIALGGVIRRGRLHDSYMPGYTYGFRELGQAR